MQQTNLVIGDVYWTSQTNEQLGLKAEISKINGKAKNTRE